MCSSEVEYMPSMQGVPGFSPQAHSHVPHTPKRKKLGGWKGSSFIKRGYLLITLFWITVSHQILKQETTESHYTWPLLNLIVTWLWGFFKLNFSVHHIAQWIEHSTGSSWLHWASCLCFLVSQLTYTLLNFGSFC